MQRLNLLINFGGYQGTNATQTAKTIMTSLPAWRTGDFTRNSETPQARLWQEPQAEINESSKQGFGQASSFKKKIHGKSSFAPLLLSLLLLRRLHYHQAFACTGKIYFWAFKKPGPNTEQLRDSFPPQLTGFSGVM